MLFMFVVPFGPSHPVAAASYCDGGAYLLSGTALLRFEPGKGLSPVATLPIGLNAVGASDGAFYGIGGRRVYRYTLDGELTDLGAADFNGAYVGAIAGGTWYLMHDKRVHSLDLASLKVSRSAVLSKPLRIGDWAAAPSGQLFAVSTLDGPPALVRIDPRDGSVTILARPSGLAPGSTYGAVWLLDDRLYALHNGTGRLYAINLAQPEPAIVVASLPPTTSADAASCPLRQLPPTASPSPSPSPTPTGGTSPAPSAAVATVATVAAAPAPPAPPAVVPPVPAAPRLSVPRATPPPPAVLERVMPQAQAGAGPPAEDRARTRKWVAAGIVALAMAGLLGARAAR